MGCKCEKLEKGIARVRELASDEAYGVRYDWEDGKLVLRSRNDGENGTDVPCPEACDIPDALATLVEKLKPKQRAWKEGDVVEDVEGAMAVDPKGGLYVVEEVTPGGVCFTHHRSNVGWGDWVYTSFRNLTIEAEERARKEPSRA